MFIDWIYSLYILIFYLLFIEPESEQKKKNSILVLNMYIEKII